ncbi:hypothetical protein AQUCO_03500150v1 [Aquilegia coerulea]|uniref:phosphatidylserine decarboxylase n=1 Tax=Aquilegia coerulea TaxID=218851 RepID=A0A2G5CWD7_AQUCA|nr:hypothetical protein AQUCO_03500150v1 [Aquilegia coerulea]
MRFRVFPKWVIFGNRRLFPQRPPHSSFSNYFTRNFQTSRASINGGGTSSSSEGNAFFVPGATVATILMLGVLHARRLYEDKKMEEAREKGIEIEFSPDKKATFLRLMPLRTISRIWGNVTSVEYPIWLRPYIYKAWARAFHSNLEEAALPLDQYASLRDFFVRTLKEGSRPIDSDPHSLASPVDGTILRFGELKPGTMIEQVKGASYSAASLLGARSFLSIAQDDAIGEIDELENTSNGASKKSWWRVSLASPKVRDTTSVRPMKGVFYCVIYLKPGDYHRVHSPVNWQVFIRRHFPGQLYPVNERARRTIKNLYVENERVVLEGQWEEGFMALAAIGATNIGSIEVEYIFAHFLYFFSSLQSKQYCVLTADNWFGACE